MAITKRGAGGLVLRNPVSTIVTFTIVALAIQLLTASPARAASLSASPSSGPPGASVEVTGTGFVPSTSVRLCWDGGRCSDLGETVPGPTGDIQVGITIPGDADAGAHTINACQRLLDLAWSCDSVGFDVIVPTTTTTSTTIAPTTTTTVPTTTTTVPTTTTRPTTTTQPRTTTTSPSVSTSPTSPPATNGTASPGTSAVGGEGSSTTATGGSTTGLAGSPTSTRPSDDTTTTTFDDQASIGPPGYQPPDDGPSLPGDFGEGETVALVEDVQEGSVGGGAGEWWVALLAVVVAGVALWVANRLIRSDRRRYMLEVAPRHR